MPTVAMQLRSSWIQLHSIHKTSYLSPLFPFLFISLPMLLAHPKHCCYFPMSNKGPAGNRPTLPPIRDLLRAPSNSPSLTLARLSVKDQEFSWEPSRLHSSSSLHQPSASSPAGLVMSNSPRSYSPIPVLDEPSFIEHLPHLNNKGRGHLGQRDRAWSHDEYQRHPQSQASIPHQNSLSPRSESNFGASRPNSQQGHISTQTRLHPLALPERDVDDLEDDEQTPVVGPHVTTPSPVRRSTIPKDRTSNSQGKYECTHCGKGFTRPSSLKIHLNSHTGEKPFVCHVEGCGRCFSVLSNMRRHARVHTQSVQATREASSDGSDQQSPPPTASSSSSILNNTHSHHLPPSLRHHRRPSTSSISSVGSRRSREALTDDEDDPQGPPEKRSRT